LDRDLVEQAQHGDRDAFAILARTHGDRLMAIAQRILRDVGRAEDVVQQTLDALEDLAGKSIAVEPGLAAEADVRAASDGLVAAGKPAIKIVTVTRSDEAWVEELTQGRIDALAGDSVHATYHAPLPPYAGKAEVGGPAINPQPIGIAIRKDDVGMKEAVVAAIDAIYADGTMTAIVAKWGVTDAVELLR
jgi:polar amino acid transport system substrate-binding protein